MTTKRVWRQCERKSRFDTDHDALKFAKKTGFNQRAYECDVCKGWHLTKKDDKECD